MKNISLLLLLILMVGCAVPEAVRKEASLTLHGACKEMFFDNSPNGYQQVSQLNRNPIMLNFLEHSCSFALSMDANGNQSCGWGSASAVWSGKECFAGCWNEGTSAEIDALAMGRCEKMRQQSQGSNPTKNSCKVFARDNNIIWNKKTYESLELE